MNQIVDGVYIGDIRAAADLFYLKSHVLVFFVTKPVGYNTCSAGTSGTKSLLSTGLQLQSAKCDGCSLGKFALALYPSDQIHKNCRTKQRTSACALLWRSFSLSCARYGVLDQRIQFLCA